MKSARIGYIISGARSQIQFLTKAIAYNEI